MRVIPGFDHAAGWTGSACVAGTPKRLHFGHPIASGEILAVNMQILKAAIAAPPRP